MNTQSLTLLMTLLCTSISGLTLKAPAVGYCDEDTVLECQVGHAFTAWTWYFGDTKLFINGKLVNIYNQNKYTDTKMSKLAKLTIHNTDPSDSGNYRCESRFEGSSNAPELPIECKASSAVHSVTNGKKVTITVDKLYPSSPTFSASFKKENTDVTIPGSRTCPSSTQYPGYYRCVWSSNNSLADGSYTYSIVVTTISQADPVKGSFRILSPPPPVIADTVTLNSSHMAVYGNEGQSLTVHCTSTGGYPTPTVVLYKDSVSSSNQLTSTSTGTLQSDGTYNVTLQHTFISTLADDKKTVICRSYYPQADSAYMGSKTTSVILYLRLKPSDPTVVQVTDVTAGSTVEVRCTTTGSRPAANITWSYQGSTYKGTVNSTFNKDTETNTVVSVYRRQVTAADNGRNIQCVVTHPALVSPPEKNSSVNFNVQFSVQASSTSITGNREMTATGTATLTLTCTSGSSNPASGITWKNGSDIITNNNPYTETTGENNGVVRSQHLVLTPTRYMDGDVITCSVSNSVSQSPVTDMATLDLRYSPLVEIRQLDQVTEGSNEQLSCKVDSKPVSSITWYHGNTQLLKETPDNNLLSYNLFPVNRSHYGIYRCKANNDINPEDEKNVSMSVRFKPLTTRLTGNNNITANGHNALSLVCTSGSSNPVSEITWRINDVITQSTSSMSDQSGQYGGMIRLRGLTRRPTRDNDGDIISCEAKNDLGTSERSETILNLKYHPLIEPMQNQVTVEGNVTVLPCKASSKPASTFRWYRQGQSNVIHEGTGTLDKNQLPYTISNTRRTDAGTYKCEADNEIEMVDTKSVSLIVNYPPDVNVLTQNTTVEQENVVLLCNASGIPNSQYKYGNWIQKWPGTDVTVNEYTESPRLVLASLTYEHSGVYSCSASNGIKVFGTDKEYMEGSELLLVKSYPVIVNVSEKVSGRLKENVTIQIDYYSNVEQSEVKCHKTVNESRQLDFVAAERYEDVKVNLRVFNHSIVTDGSRAFIMVKINSVKDFGFYDVVVENDIKAVFGIIEIVPKGPPSEPYNVTIDSVSYESARLSWIRGYHGGAEQSFVVEVSTDRNKWREVKTVFGGSDESEVPISAVLTGLHESTLYFLRMYAFNEEGKSSYTAYISFTMGTRDSPVPSALIGGVAGGAAAFVVFAVVVVVLLRRRNFFTKGKTRTSDDTSDRKPVYKDEDNDYGMQDNPMYVSAGPRNDKQASSSSSAGDSSAEYSTVNKTKPMTSTSTVYAEVDRTKKNKAKQEKKQKHEKSKQGFFKDKKGKQLAQEGDIYENASTTELQIKKAKSGDNNEPVYENPEPAKKSGKKNVNKDGLIYADLAFNDQPKGQRKLVIHGLDDMTEYVQVDFTKKADPLPDSDDESGPPKN